MIGVMNATLAVTKGKPETFKSERDILQAFLSLLK